MFFAILCEIFNRIFNTSMILFITNHRCTRNYLFYQKTFNVFTKDNIISLFSVNGLLDLFS